MRSFFFVPWGWGVFSVNEIIQEHRPQGGVDKKIM